MQDWEEWCPQKAVEELTVRRALADVEDPVKLANELLRDTLPLAVMGMTHSAVHEPDAKLRFAAQRYVIERSMGSVQNPVRPVDERPAWEKIFDQVAVSSDESK